MRCSCCATGSGDKRPIAGLISGALLSTHKPTVTSSSLVALLSLAQQTYPWSSVTPYVHCDAKNLEKMACHLLQFGPTNAPNFIVTISQHTSSYKCRASLVHRHGAQNGIKGLLTIDDRHV
jgi:hypothetical protein